MRIAQIAPPFESVPPVGYGGTERVISILTEELVRRGHDVTLFASGDSRTTARLVPVVDRALWRLDLQCPNFMPYWSLVLGKLTRELGEFDIVHSHVDYFAFPIARVAPCPVVTTLHGRLDLSELQPIFREFSDVPLVSISDSQRCPVPDANWVATVYNGIELDQLSFNQRPNQRPGSYLAFLGRISPEKGLDIAIRVARRVGMPLKIAARMPLPFKNDPGVRADWEYYEQVIKPLVREPGVEMVGEVAGEQKSAFLGNAAAVLFPVRWPEPFGLVMAEALACGTPVLALRNGSVPEVLKDGVTGFICEHEDELVEAVARIGEIDRARCRLEAEQRFSPAAMADGYERVFERLVQRRRAFAVVTGEARDDGALRKQKLHHPPATAGSVVPVAPIVETLQLRRTITPVLPLDRSLAC